MQQVAGGDDVCVSQHPAGKLEPNRGALQQETWSLPRLVALFRRRLNGRIPAGARSEARWGDPSRLKPLPLLGLAGGVGTPAEALGRLDRPDRYPRLTICRI